MKKVPSGIQRKGQSKRRKDTMKETERRKDGRKVMKKREERETNVRMK